MAAPFTPAEIKALLPSPTANMCTAFARALLALPAKFYELVSYMFNADGTTNIEFLQATGTTSVVLTPGMTIWDFSTISDEWPIPGDPDNKKGRLECTGQAVSRTIYSELFAKIGETWGVGDGVTTFNVPDGRARVLVGVGQGTDDQPVPFARSIALAESDGEFDHTLVTSEMPAHTHGGVVTSGGGAQVASGGSYATGNTNQTGGGDEHNNMMPYIGVRLYIKT